MARLRATRSDEVNGLWILPALRCHQGPLSAGANRHLDALAAEVRAKVTGPERARLLAEIEAVRDRR